MYALISDVFTGKIDISLRWVHAQNRIRGCYFQDGLAEGTRTTANVEPT
jgi:hypothetical protein